MVPVGELEFHPRNANEGDFGVIYESVETSGFYGALVVQRSTRHVLAGNHRLAVARKHGIPELPVIWLDVDDEQALRILTVDNRSTRLGQDNSMKLIDVLNELNQTATGLTGTGYDRDDLDNLINDLNTDLDAGGGGQPGEGFNVTVICANAEERDLTIERLRDMDFQVKR